MNLEMWRILKGISNEALKRKLEVSAETLKKLKEGKYRGCLEVALKVAVLTEGAVNMLDIIPQELLDKLVGLSLEVREEKRKEKEPLQRVVNSAVVPEKKMVWEK